MDAGTEQREMMELLAQNEETISNLYRTFAEKFSPHKQFWATLSQEELIHASWIRKLFSQAENANPLFNKDRFKAETIRNSLGYVKEQIQRFTNEELSLKDALSTALDIEITLLESKFYQVYETDTEILKELLGALKDAFMEHRNRLQQKLEIVA